MYEYMGIILKYESEICGVKSLGRMGSECTKMALFNITMELKGQVFLGPGISWCDTQTSFN
jgi:hypothetical protein